MDRRAEISKGANFFARKSDFQNNVRKRIETILYTVLHFHR